MSGTPGILVYAELLSNIRQISVGCSLPSPAAAGTTQAGISPDGASLTVRHAGEECTARLPARAVPIASLPVPAGGPLSLAWRLPLASPPSAARRVDEAQEAGPWTATGLAPGSGVTCRTCRAPIIPEGALAVWKDLPSENWAEMMEFWHCHKPHHDHGHADDQDHDHAHGHDRDGAKLGNEDLAARGYGANSRISAQPGTGFVDLTSFLFFEQDCTGLTTATARGDDSSVVPRDQPTNGSARQGTPVHCSTCSAELGTLYEQTASVALYKWQVSILVCGQNQAARSEAPSLANCVSSMLISTLSRSGCSKSIIQPMNPTTSSTIEESKTTSPDTGHTVAFPEWDPSSSLLHIWLFNKNIAFTSTARAKSEGRTNEMDEAAVPAVKVLYRLVSREEADRLNQSMTSDVQDIALPDSAVRDVRELLERSTEFLPESDRQFGGLWKVGLLEKWRGGSQ